MKEELIALTKISKTLKILYVEDNDDVREQTQKLLSNFFDEIIIAIDGKDGLKKFEEHKDSLNIVFTDINMPNMNGIEMLEGIRKINTTIPCIVISAHNESNFFLQTIKLGVDGYLLKPINVQQFLDTLTKILQREKLRIENIEFSNSLENLNNDLEMQVISRIGEIFALNKEIEDTQKEVIFTLASIGEARSKETGNHVQRVSIYSEILALKYGLSKDEANLIKLASPMHDIGKVGIPDSILNKQGRHTPEETIIMQTHAQMGYEMLKASKRPILEAAAIIAHQHHERYDGTGYPNKIKGEDIHIYGRITALADVFDALGSSRVYKPAWEDEKIFQLFKEESGKQFDPKLVEIFFEHIDEFIGIRDTYA